MSACTLSVVIPALNEEAGIGAICRRVLSARDEFGQMDMRLELIVVDDGSSDATPALASAIPGVRLVSHAANMGYGAALKTGFGAASGEWIGFLDADGTYPPEHFPALYRAGMDQGADVVIGSRMAGATTEMPFVRKLGNRIFAGLVSLVSAQHITDSASGMRLFRREVLERLYPLPDGLNLTPVMSTRALHERVKVIEVPIPYSERVGRSKLSVVRDGVRFAQSIVWTALSYNPVRPLGLMGLAAVAVAALIGLGLIVARATGSTSIGPWGVFALFAGMVLGVMGVSTLTLGISFNYFVALFHKQPVRQGFAGRSLNLHLDRRLGPLGLLALAVGVALGIVSLVLGLEGQPASRLWLYYMACASFLLVGLQLVIGWVQIQVLQALRSRDEDVAEDMQPERCTGGRDSGS